MMDNNDDAHVIFDQCANIYIVGKYILIVFLEYYLSFMDSQLCKNSYTLTVTRI